MPTLSMPWVKPLNVTGHTRHPFGFRLGENGAGDAVLVQHEGEQDAIRQMVRMRTIERLPLRTVVAAMAAKGHSISPQGVADIVKAASARGIGRSKRKP